jgi:hypothetical protein
VEEEEDASLGRFLCLFYDRATTEDQWQRQKTSVRFLKILTPCGLFQNAGMLTISI